MWTVTEKLKRYVDEKDWGTPISCRVVLTTARAIHPYIPSDLARSSGPSIGPQGGYATIGESKQIFRQSPLATDLPVVILSNFSPPLGDRPLKE